jgi:hypothetical protein
VPETRSASLGVTAERVGGAVVVRGSYFVGIPGGVLTARVTAAVPESSVLELTAQPPSGVSRGPVASHFDYEATLPADRACELTVVHRRLVGTPRVDTVFRKRVF